MKCGMDSGLLVGAGIADITPPLDQSRRAEPDGIATGVVDRICARACVFSDGVEKAALVLLDVCEHYPNITRGIRELAAARTDIRPDSIMVCSTHTHSGPIVIDGEGRPDCGELSAKTRAYIDSLCEKAAGALRAADRDMVPVTARVGCVAVPGIGRPSRIRLKDGSTASLGNERGIADIPPDAIESESPYDDCLRLALFEDSAGRPVCALASFGCHNNIALMTTSLTPDFFGYAMCRAEEAVGGGFVLLMMPGSIADVQPLAGIDHRTCDPETHRIIPPGRGDDLVPPAGEILLAGMRKAWSESVTMTAAKVRSVSRLVKLPWRDPLPAIGPAYLENRKAGGGLQDDENAITELQAIRIGDLALLGIGGEVFNETAAELRERSPFPHTWTISNANDSLKYIYPEWELERDLAAGRDNTQFRFCIMGADSEPTVVSVLDEMLHELMG